MGLAQFFWVENRKRFWIAMNPFKNLSSKIISYTS